MRESECASKPKNGGIVKKRVCMRFLQKKKIAKRRAHPLRGTHREGARARECVYVLFFFWRRGVGSRAAVRAARLEHATARELGACSRRALFLTLA